MKNSFGNFSIKLTALMLIISQSVFFAFAQTRGAGNVKVTDTNGKTREVKLYDGSYALVIGESNYTAGWDALNGVRSDAAEVGRVLEKDFTVEVEMDLKSDALKTRIEKFISDYGYAQNNRLLIYFAGHGHTAKSLDGRDLGYIIPVDAPLPDKDALGFKRKAIPMDTIQDYARRIEAKHALFVFDSCFSGKLVSREASVVPPVIREDVTFPVRQFITAGAANQSVPDDSVFRKVFVRGLEGEADLNNDGYITGTELASFLKDKVTNATDRAQTPQYGKIRDIDLERGDFVFVTVNKKITNAATSNTAVSEPPPTVEIDKDAGEREAWNQIKDSTNRSDYALFAETFPGGIYAAQARARWETVWWNQIKNSSNKADYEAFLKEFSSGQYAGAAKFAVRRLETTAVIETPTNSGGTSANKTAGAISKARLANNVEMSFAYIPAGEFQMGSNNGEANEKPVHTVRISQGFQMQTTEVTQGQWKAIMNALPSKCDYGSLSGDFVGDNKPIICVSWDDAQEFVRQMNAKNDGYKYRLPSEAEWEYAARTGTTGDYAGNLDSMAWYGSNSGSKTHEVATKQANAWGLYDMHGNVWEWVQDWYPDSYYAGSPAINPMGASSGSSRGFRGGGWDNIAPDLRSANRDGYSPSVRDHGLGFRVVRITP